MKEHYLNLLEDYVKLSNWIDTLSYEERVKLREELESDKCDKLIKNLYFDYDKQCWID